VLQLFSFLLWLQQISGEKLSLNLYFQVHLVSINFTAFVTILLYFVEIFFMFLLILGMNDQWN